MNSKSSKPFLSIIIPLHNEAGRIDKCLSLSTEWLCKQGYGEILLVDNGSTDNTLELANWWAERMFKPAVRVLSIPQRSKALAVAAGMLAAEGKYFYMADVDLSTPIEAIENFFEKIFEGNDIVIGSRYVKGAQVRQAFSRRVMGRIFNLYAGGILPGIRDTQCGFKMFTRRARGLFQDLSITSMAFDVEVLLRARQAGLSIYELPVPWKEASGSRVRPIRDGLAMLKDVMSLRRIPRGAILSPRLNESR